MEISFQLTGLASLDAKFRRIVDQFGDSAADALRAEADIEMTEAKQRTPVRTGVLRASGTVSGPEHTSDGWEVTMGFGGAASAYALEVHENLAAFHPVGQAKYLESVVLESAPYLAARVAERLRRGAGAAFAPSASEVAESQAAVRAIDAAINE